MSSIKKNQDILADEMLIYNSKANFELLAKKYSRSVSTIRRLHLIKKNPDLAQGQRNPGRQNILTIQQIYSILSQRRVDFEQINSPKFTKRMQAHLRNWYEESFYHNEKKFNLNLQDKKQNIFSRKYVNEKKRLLIKYIHSFSSDILFQDISSQQQFSYPSDQSDDQQYLDSSEQSSQDQTQLFNSPNQINPQNTATHNSPLLNYQNEQLINSINYLHEDNDNQTCFKQINNYPQQEVDHFQNSDDINQDLSTGENSQSQNSCDEQFNQSYEDNDIPYFKPYSQLDDLVLECCEYLNIPYLNILDDQHQPSFNFYQDLSLQISYD